MQSFDPASTQETITTRSEWANILQVHFDALKRKYDEQHKIGMLLLEKTERPLNPLNTDCTVLFY